MSTVPAATRTVEVSGAEALGLLEGSTLGRLVHPRREATVVRPGRHTGEYGHLAVRAPVQATAVPSQRRTRWTRHVPRPAPAGR